MQLVPYTLYMQYHLDFIIHYRGITGILEKCRSAMNFDFRLYSLGYFERIP